MKTDKSLHHESLEAKLGFCPVELGLKFLAGAWTPQILWALREKPKRFGELRRELKGVSAKVLTTRLRELEERDLITRKVNPTSPPSVEYAKTELALEIEPVLCKVAELGHKMHTRMQGKREQRAAAQMAASN
jgi:DNA-binding HxlR family transcriptional regulator